MPTAVLGATAVLVAALLAITGLLIWQGYYDRLERTGQQTISASHVVSVHAEWLIEATNQALRRIVTVAGPRPATSSATTEELHAELAGLPADVIVGLYGSDGALLRGDKGVPASIAGTDYFAAISAGAEWQISPFLPSENGELSRFAMVRRFDQAGTFTGVAAAFISAAVMENFWASLDLGPNSTVALVRSDGQLIARYPSPPGPLDLSTSELFTEQLPASEIGSYAQESPIDGIPRVVGYRKIEDLPVLALASASEGRVVGEFWRGVIIVMALLVALIIPLVLGALWLARIMRRDERTQQKLRQAADDNQTLMREIHHRVKNNLQAVSSLVQLQPLPAAARLEMSRRINAMVSVHEHIYRSDQYAAPQVDAYIRTIVENARQGFDAPVEISYDLAPLTVDKDRATPLGLIVSEVVSNAFKHAFPDRTDGKLSVTLSETETGEGLLVIKDNGVGFEEQDRSSGMGRRLIEGLTAQLTGSYAFEQDGGTRFSLRFPIERVLVAA